MIKKILAFAISLIGSASAYGHHSFSAEFDANKFISVTGTVTEVRFRNPHIQYFMDVDTEGQMAQWVVAGQNVIVMRRSGVTARTIGIGNTITVSGYAGRDGAHRVYLDSMETASGTLYSMYGDAARRRSTWPRRTA